MFLARLIATLAIAPLTALATPYSAYNSFNTQLTRAFAVPQTTTTYTRTTTYSSSSTLTNEPNTPSSPRSFSNPVATQSGSNSWAMPDRTAPFSWGPGASTAKSDPVNDEMIRLILKAKASGKRPDLTKATELELYNFYTAFGVRRSEALTAALNDYRDGTQMINATRSAEQNKVQAYMAKEAATRVEYNRELQRVKAVALALGDVATAQAWLDLAHPKGLWRGAVIEYNPKESAEATFHAARKGIPRAIERAWEKFRRDDPEGFVWRDRCVALGNLRAMQAAYDAYANGPKTNYRAAVELFERSYPQLPPTVASSDSVSTKGAGPAKCAYVLSQLYARGDATLPADGAAALAWAQRLPALPPQGWQEWSGLTRVNALTELMQNPAAQTVEKELREAWLDLARLQPTSLTLSTTSQTFLAEIYSGNHPAFPNSKNPVAAEAALLQVQDLAEKDFGAAIWLIRFCNRMGEWDRAGATADFDVKWANAILAYELGLYWRDRTDGKADAAKAIMYLDAAAKKSAPMGLIALAETYLKLGRLAEAEQALINPWKDGNDRLSGFDLFRMVVQRGIMQYRGDFGKPNALTGELSFNRARFLRTLLTSPTREQRDYIRYFEFQSAAMPLLYWQEDYNQYDRALDKKLEQWAGNVPQNSEDAKARADDLETLETNRRINADYRRKAFEKALPQLYALALTDYAPAQKLWAWVALSGQAKVSPEDAHTAKKFLYTAAKGGDTASISMLGQLLLEDGQRVAATESATSETLAGIYTEAADWLEAAQQNGASEVLWPLVTVYREGLGRTKSPEKVVALLESLAASGDSDAKVALSKTRT